MTTLIEIRTRVRGNEIQVQERYYDGRKWTTVTKREPMSERQLATQAKREKAAKPDQLP